MKKNLLQRIIIIALVTLVGLWVVLGPRHKPSAKDFTLAGINNTLRENIHLGLDLRGGSHLVMQVQVPDYLKRVTENAATGVQNAAREQGYNIKGARPEIADSNYRVILEAEDGSKIQEMREQLPGKVNDFGSNYWQSTASGNTVTWEMTETAKTELGKRATQDALRIIETRINAVGVAEPTLQEHGAANSHQILLQMPGITDPERVKKLITGESRLELMKVVGPGNPSPITTYPSEQAAIASLGGTVPQNRRVLPYDEREEPTTAGQTPPSKPGEPKSWVVVESPAIVDGSDLRSADSVSASPAGGDDGFHISFHAEAFGSVEVWHLDGAERRRVHGRRAQRPRAKRALH